MHDNKLDNDDSYDSEDIDDVVHDLDAVPKNNSLIFQKSKTTVIRKHKNKNLVTVSPR